MVTSAKFQGSTRVQKLVSFKRLHLKLSNVFSAITKDFKREIFFDSHKIDSIINQTF